MTELLKIPFIILSAISLIENAVCYYIEKFMIIPLHLTRSEIFDLDIGFIEKGLRFICNLNQFLSNLFP